jgi:hypothetical protein
MKAFAGITDREWFDLLTVQAQLDEIRIGGSPYYVLMSY